MLNESSSHSSAHHSDRYTDVSEAASVVVDGMEQKTSEAHPEGRSRRAPASGITSCLDLGHCFRAEASSIFQIVRQHFSFWLVKLQVPSPPLFVSSVLRLNMFEYIAARLPVIFHKDQ